MRSVTYAQVDEFAIHCTGFLGSYFGGCILRAISSVSEDTISIARRGYLLTDIRSWSEVLQFARLLQSFRKITVTRAMTKAGGSTNRWQFEKIPIAKMPHTLRYLFVRHRLFDQRNRKFEIDEKPQRLRRGALIGFGWTRPRISAANTVAGVQATVKMRRKMPKAKLRFSLKVSSVGAVPSA